MTYHTLLSPFPIRRFISVLHYHKWNVDARSIGILMHLRIWICSRLYGISQRVRFWQLCVGWIQFGLYEFYRFRHTEFLLQKSVESKTFRTRRKVLGKMSLTSVSLHISHSEWNWRNPLSVQQGRKLLTRGIVLPQIPSSKAKYWFSIHLKIENGITSELSMAVQDIPRDQNFLSKSILSFVRTWWPSEQTMTSTWL